jgi:hypothetical protein
MARYIAIDLVFFLLPFAAHGGSTPVALFGTSTIGKSAPLPACPLRALGC